ncbi:TetR family transcriptional regulator [Saccharopolyspora phatthalungensis]|uniref:AcrR family transcriptional regulator n=1 Tax=Saccharopolyspora phatthalungensis TaxID=664693 RepID=A0A840QDT0_9PSEU|nr:TetR family transcriptional regulator [Saccharopolyspora phatthalungensis]MBB5158101.1 AcrR family transcriptional regulator [Saccharopolyspora phatthalungensis]
MSVPTDHGGLRARKKQRTRAALIDAGLDLFLAKGYDATTIDEIAAEVEISPRTFFRYFAGKEDVALAKGAELDDLVLNALAARPADEPPLVALRAAVLDMIRKSASGDGVRRFLRIQHLINKTPALLAGNLRRAAGNEERLTVEIAARQGVDPARDMRPRVLVGMICAALRIGLETMCADRHRDLSRLVELVEEAIDLATAGIPRRWGDEPHQW